MKVLLERSLPIQKAFIRLYQGEAHHVQRNVEEKNAIIVAYGNASEEEKDLFRRLVARNSHNMLFKNYKIVFTQKENLNDFIKKEVSLWEN